MEQKYTSWYTWMSMVYLYAGVMTLIISSQSDYWLGVYGGIFLTVISFYFAMCNGWNYGFDEGYNLRKEEPHY